MLKSPESLHTIRKGTLEWWPIYIVQIVCFWHKISMKSLKGGLLFDCETALLAYFFTRAKDADVESHAG